MPSALPPANSCVDTTCDDQITVQVPGPTGAAGAAGTNGTDGDNAWTTLTAPFTMPAQSGSGTATVGNSDWLAYGQIVILGDLLGTQYAVMQVTDKPASTTVTLLNLQDGAGAYSGNVAPATVLPTGTALSVSGLQGVAGTSGAPVDARYWVGAADGTLSSEHNIGALTDGVVKHVSGTPAQSVPCTAIDSVTPAANKLPYFTGATTAAVTDLSAFGITLIDDASAAAARTTLGLGTIATQSAAAVAITGGTSDSVTFTNVTINSGIISGITDLAVADGGTGASTASAAKTNLGVGTAYAELYEDNAGGSTITVTTAGNYYPWTTSTVGEDSGSSQADADATSDDITIGASGGGRYQVSVSCSFGGTGNAVVKAAVFKNGARQSNIAFTRKLSVGGDVGSASASGMLSLVNTDTVDLRFTSDGNGDSVTIYNCNLSIERV